MYVTILIFIPKKRDKTFSVVDTSALVSKHSIGTGRHWRHVPPRFCNKQRCAIFIFRICCLYLKEKSVLEVLCSPSLTCLLLPTALRHIFEGIEGILLVLSEYCYLKARVLKSYF